MNITEIIAVSRNLVDATSVSFPDATFLLYANPTKQEIYARLIALSKNIKFDSQGNSDLPVATFDLEDGVQDYAFDKDVWAIDRVEVADVDGKFHRVTKIHEKNVPEALTEHLTGGGLPTEYSRRANSLFFYPIPAAASVTLTDGGKIYYQRGDTDWTTDDITTGTAVPGFAVPYHMLLCYKTMLPYAVKFKPNYVNGMLNMIKELEAGLFAIESNKDGDKNGRLNVKVENTR